MANVEPESVPTHTNYKELVDVVCITGVYCLTMVLWLLFGHDHSVIWIFNCWFLYLLWLVMRDNCFEWGTELSPMIFFLVYFYYISSNKDFVGRMLVVGSTFASIGVTGVLLVILVSLIRKKYQGSYVTNLVSNQVVMVILSVSCTLFFNGYALLCYTWVKRGSHVWKVLGIVLLAVLGLLTTVCCVVSIVSRWREYHHSRVSVKPVEDEIQA